MYGVGVVAIVVGADGVVFVDCALLVLVIGIGGVSDVGVAIVVGWWFCQCW